MKAVVIGAGAAGMLCAAELAERGVDVVVIERNSKCGKKLFITGKGRCNVTNDCDVPTYLSKIVTNPKFMYSAAYGFSPSDAIALFSGKLGLALKTERGGRVFPVSDKSSDVIKALEKYMRVSGVRVKYDERATAVCVEGGKAVAVVTDKAQYAADAVVVATGGITYPSTGSTGDGYRFARDLGLKVVTPRPTLVAFVTRGAEGLQGLSLKNVALSVVIDGAERAHAFGEMLFTHTGISGPIVLECSSLTSKYRDENGAFPKRSKAIVDFKPALDIATLDARIVREFTAAPHATLKTIAAKLLPRALVPYALKAASLQGDTRADATDREARRRLAHALKNFELELVGAEGAEQAIITSGGVDVKELDPKTMRCRKIDGLYFVGEVIDVDALTGGFNLQTAWASAEAAARAIASSASKSCHIKVDSV